MNNAVSIVLLVAGLAVPILLFGWLRSRRWNGWRAAGLAVAAGWALNVAWAWSLLAASGGDAVAENVEMLRIAARFGWVCPSVLVLLTALVLRFVTRRAG